VVEGHLLRFPGWALRDAFVPLHDPIIRSLGATVNPDSLGSLAPENRCTRCPLVLKDDTGLTGAVPQNITVVPEGPVQLEIPAQVVTTIPGEVRRFRVVVLKGYK
jgi:hypothetical protein